MLQTFAPRRANRRAAASGMTPVVSRPSVTNTAPASSSDGIRSSTSSSAAEKSVVRPPNSYGSTSYLEPSIDSTCAAQFVATERRVCRTPSSAPASPGAPSARCIESERSRTTATRRWRLRVTSWVHEKCASSHKRERTATALRTVRPREGTRPPRSPSSRRQNRISARSRRSARTANGRQISTPKLRPTTAAKRSSRLRAKPRSIETARASASSCVRGERSPSRARQRVSQNARTELVAATE